MYICTSYIHLYVCKCVFDLPALREIKQIGGLTLLGIYSTDFVPPKHLDGMIFILYNSYNYVTPIPRTHTYILFFYFQMCTYTATDRAALQSRAIIKIRMLSRTLSDNHGLA